VVGQGEEPDRAKKPGEQARPGDGAVKHGPPPLGRNLLILPAKFSLPACEAVSLLLGPCRVDVR
jgi:hypothetical protein